MMNFFTLWIGGKWVLVSKNLYDKISCTVIAKVEFEHCLVYIKDDVLEGVENGILFLGRGEKPKLIEVEVQGYSNKRYWEKDEYNFLDPCYKNQPA